MTNDAAPRNTSTPVAYFVKDPKWRIYHWVRYERVARPHFYYLYNIIPI